MRCPIVSSETADRFIWFSIHDSLWLLIRASPWSWREILRSWDLPHETHVFSCLFKISRSRVFMHSSHGWDLAHLNIIYLTIYCIGNTVLNQRICLHFYVVLVWFFGYFHTVKHSRSQDLKISCSYKVRSWMRWGKSRKEGWIVKSEIHFLPPTSYFLPALSSLLSSPYFKSVREADTAISNF